MKLLFWNMRGFERPARRTQVKEYIREEKLDGIGLPETIRVRASLRRSWMTSLEAVVSYGSGNLHWVTLKES
jgi:hypothetical protein